MTAYGDTSPLRGAGQASDGDIIAWFGVMGQQLAPQFAPDRTYQAVPALAQAVGPAARAYGINSDLLAAQICKESAAGQSAIFRAKWNPSGLGAVNDNPSGAAIDFKSGDARWGQGIAAGVHATVAHLLSYLDGRDSKLWGDDPRATAIPTDRLGTVRVLRDLDGRWAVPGVGYGAGIAALANQIVAYAREHGGLGMAELWYPNAKRSTTPYQNVGSDFGRSFPSTVPDVVMHHTAGSYQSAINYFAAPGRGSSGTSAHFVISRSGEVTQIVPLGNIAWHAGSWDENVRSIGIEHEQSQINGQWQDWPDALLNASAALLTWLKGQMPHFSVYPHSQFTSTGCPGDLPIQEILKRMGGATVPAAKPAVRVDPATGKKLIGGMRSYYELLESKLGPDETLLLVGRPLTDEFVDTDGVTRQVFERQVWEWRKGSRPQQFDILGLRLGDDWLKAHPRK